MHVGQHPKASVTWAEAGWRWAGLNPFICRRTAFLPSGKMRPVAWLSLQ